MFVTILSTSRGNIPIFRKSSYTMFFSYSRPGFGFHRWYHRHDFVTCNVWCPTFLQRTAWRSGRQPSQWWRVTRCQPRKALRVWAAPVRNTALKWNMYENGFLNHSQSVDICGKWTRTEWNGCCVPVRVFFFCVFATFHALWSAKQLKCGQTKL